VLIGDDDDALARHAIGLLEDPAAAAAHSRAARQQVERRYGLDQSYGRFVEELEQWVRQRRAAA
jgi:hypothetical protein